MDDNDFDDDIIVLKLDTLPELILRLIGSYLDVKSFLNCFYVCKRVCQVLDHRFLWRILYERQFGHALALCCIENRMKSLPDDLALISEQSQFYVENKNKSNVDKIDSLRCNQPECITLMDRLAWRMPPQSVDFCCLHWKQIWKRRVFVEQERVVTMKHVGRKLNKPSEADSPPLSPDPIQQLADLVDSMEQSLSESIQAKAAAPTSSTTHASTSSTSTTSDAVSLLGDNIIDYQLHEPQQDSSENEWSDDDDEEEESVDTSEEWRSVDPFDDYEGFENIAELQNTDDETAFQLFYPALERQKIRSFQVCNPNYKFGYDTVADARVFYSRANIAATHVSNLLNDDLPSSPQECRRQWHAAWRTGAVAAELYASAAIARRAAAFRADDVKYSRHFSNSNNGNSTAGLTEDIVSQMGAGRTARGRRVISDVNVVYEFEDYELVIGDEHSNACVRAYGCEQRDQPNPNEKIRSQVPDKRRRQAVHLVDIYKDWGVLLSTLARLCLQANTLKIDVSRVQPPLVSDDDFQERDAQTRPKAAGSGDASGQARASSERALSTERTPTIAELTETYDTDANDDVLLPGSVRFVGLERHENDSVTIEQDHVDAQHNAKTTLELRNSNRSLAITLFRLAIGYLRTAVRCADVHIIKTQEKVYSWKERRKHERKQQALDSNSENDDFDVHRPSIVKRELDRARDAHTAALQRHTACLFCLADVCSDFARHAPIPTITHQLYAASCAHYASVADSGLHTSLAMDYLGATLDSWARATLSPPTMLAEQDDVPSVAAAILHHADPSAPVSTHQLPPGYAQETVEGGALLSRSSRFAVLQHPVRWAAMRQLLVVARRQYAEAMRLAADDAIIPMHWGQSLQFEGTERGGATSVRLALASVRMMERALTMRPLDAFVLRSLGDSRVDTAKALRRFVGDDESGLRWRRAPDGSMCLAPLAEDVSNKSGAADMPEYDHSTAELGCQVVLSTDANELRQMSLDYLLQANEAYAKAAEAREGYVVALNNHGLAISTLAKWTSDPEESNRLFMQSYQIFDSISRPLSPATYHCQSNFAMTLAAQAALQHWRGEEQDSRRLLRMSVSKLRPLLEMGDAWAAFCLARVHSVAHRYDECRLWLARCAHRNYLGQASDSQMAFFDNVKHFKWFQDMLQQAIEREQTNREFDE